MEKNIKKIEEFDATYLVGINVILLDCVEEIYKKGRKFIRVPDIELLSYTSAMLRCLVDVSFNGSEIKNIRKILGWSVKDLEKKLKIRSETISRWENDKHTMGGYVEQIFRIHVCEELKDKCFGIDYNAKKIINMKIKKQTDKIYLKLSRVKMKEHNKPSSLVWEETMLEAA